MRSIFWHLSVVMRMSLLFMSASWETEKKNRIKKKIQNINSTVNISKPTRHVETNNVEQCKPVIYTGHSTSSAHLPAPLMEPWDTHPCDHEGGAGHPLRSGNLSTRGENGRKSGEHFIKEEREHKTFQKKRDTKIWLCKCKRWASGKYCFVFWLECLKLACLHQPDQPQY